MVGTVTWIPTLFEFVVLTFVAICYLLPGILLGDILFRQKRKLWRISLGTSIILTYYIIIGFILSSLALLVETIYALIWFGTLFCIGIPWILSRRDSLHLELNEDTKKLGVFIFTVFLFLFLAYFSWEGKNHGVGGWDRSEHVVKLLYLVYHNTIPETEIGMLTNAFYPQGLNLNLFMFYSLTHTINHQIVLQMIIVWYFAANLAALVIPLAAVASEIKSDIRLVMLTVFCYIPGSYLLIFESMPSSLAMFLVGNILLLSITEKQTLRFIPIKILLLLGVIAIHLVIFLYTSLILIGIAISRFRYPRQMFVGIITSFISLILAGLFYAGLLFTTEPSLLWGTIEFAFNAQNPIPRSTLPLLQFNVFSLLPTRFSGFSFYLFTIMGILPVFLLGLYNVFREKHWGLAGLCLVSIYISLAEFARFNNRVRFFMLYPVAIISAIGILVLIDIIRSRNWSDTISLFHPKQAATLVISLIVLSSVFTCVSFASAGYGNATSSWAGRDHTFLDNGVFLCVGWMHLAGLNDIGIIATPHDAVYYQIFESLSNNKILMGSTWDSPQSFADVRLLFNDTTDSTIIQEIVSNYHIEAFLVRGDDASYDHILEIYSGTTLFYGPYDYVVGMLSY
ncbi:MAG: membrane protein of unknown function [Candidatus Thorarchaeota archaeon]|nr:MAG: membrane protein of unknown function [Candidatus Thorarchaeota archaeon]